MKNKIIIISICFIAIAAIILCVPIPRNVKKTISGIETNANTDVEIKVDVTYYNYLVRRDTLKGFVTVSPYDLDNVDEAEFELRGVYYKDFNGDNLNWANLDRYNVKSNVRTYGVICFDRNFDRVKFEHSIPVVDENRNVIVNENGEAKEKLFRCYISVSEEHTAEQTEKFFEPIGLSIHHKDYEY